LHRLRFDLDCSTGGLPCTDQGAVVSYGGDSTVTTDCPGVTWSTNVPGGGSATNEIVFTPSSLIVIPGGASNFCHPAFDPIVANPTDPTIGVCVQTHMFASDSTPCPDTDGIACTTAGCDGQGVCDQDHIDTCCDLSVDKTACVAPPPGPGCTGGAIALTLKYTGPTISGPTTVTVKGSSGATTTYTLASLNNGDVLTKTSENGFTIDATAHGQSKLGST